MWIFNTISHGNNTLNRRLYPREIMTTICIHLTIVFMHNWYWLRKQHTQTHENACNSEGATHKHFASHNDITSAHENIAYFNAPFTWNIHAWCVFIEIISLHMFKMSSLRVHEFLRTFLHHNILHIHHGHARILHSL
jgi:hypothetical protein